MSFWPHSVLVSDIKKNKAYEHLNERKFSTAVWYIDRLNALGFSQEEIIVAISRPGDWNEDKGVWEGLDKMLQEQMVEKDIDEADLESSVIARDLVLEIEKHKVRQIVRDVIVDNYGEEIEEYRKLRRSLKGIIGPWGRRKKEALIQSLA